MFSCFEFFAHCCTIGEKKNAECYFKSNALRALPSSVKRLLEEVVCKLSHLNAVVMCDLPQLLIFDAQRLATDSATLPIVSSNIPLMSRWCSFLSSALSSWYSTDASLNHFFSFNRSNSDSFTCASLKRYQRYL